MPSRTFAIGLVLVLWVLPRGAELTLDGETRGVDAKDWPTYNCDVLGWRHNAGETALSTANVARLEEKWRFPPKGAGFEIGDIHATPVVVNGCVYFGTVNNAAFYKLTPGGKVKWSFPLNEKDDRVNKAEVGIVNGIYGSALVTEDAVYFGTLASNKLVALDAATGEKLSEIQLPPVWSGPAVSRGRVYVGTGNIVLPDPGFRLGPLQSTGTLFSFGLPGEDEVSRLGGGKE